MGRKYKRCALPGKLSSSERTGLPKKAFALPSKRKYPVFVAGPGNSIVPSPSHARNALARASAEFNRGNLTSSEYKKIQATAKRVLTSCDGSELHLCDSGNCYRV